MYLYQEHDGFLFNSDAHFLYDFISRFSPRGNVLDIGSGCGIVGLLTARDFPIKLTMIDIQHHNALLSARNAAVNRIEAEVIEGNFLSHSFTERFDYILSNPPYYHAGADRSESDSVAVSKHAAFLEFEAMVSRINTIIKPRGHFLFCYDAKQLPMLMAVLRAAKFPVTDLRFVHGTAAKPAQLVLVHAQKGSRALTRIHPPLIHFQEGEMTEEVKSIYQKTRTYSIKCKIS